MGGAACASADADRAPVAYYAARRQGAEDAERYANEIRFRAERRLGEITREMEKASAGRKPANGNARHGGDDSAPTKVEALAAAGIATEDASRYERIAAIP